MGGFNIQSDDALSSTRVTYENGGSNANVIIPKDGGKLSVGTHLSGLTPYHLLEGSVQVLNTVSTPAVSNVMYTGTGAALDVNIGMDMDSQWGNLPSERFGGLTLIRGNNASDTVLTDTVRGPSTSIQWNSNLATAGGRINSFASTGFQVTAGQANANTSGVVYQSLSFGTNRRRSGTTNHGMSFTEHYNMESGFTILSWVGSGKDRHEIPHMLGRKFDLYMVKNVTTGATDFITKYNGQRPLSYIKTNGFDQEIFASGIKELFSTENYLSLHAATPTNNAGDTFICYAWSNAYLDSDRKLLGNYEILKLSTNDISNGDFVRTKGKPLCVLYKQLTSPSNWWFISAKNGTNVMVPFTDSSVSATTITGGTFTFTNDGFYFPAIGASNFQFEKAGLEFLIMVIYDNDNGSGKSMYPRSTDNSTLNVVNARIPFAAGLDSNGSAKISTLNRNELVTAITLFPGKNYLSMNNVGVYSNSTYNPNYNVYSGFGDYYDSNRNKWYKNVSIVSDNFTSDTLANYTAENASLSIINGKLKVQNTGTNITGKAKRSFTTVVGKRYALVYDFNSTYVWSGVGIGTSDGNNELLLFNTSVDYNGKGIKYFTATTTTSYLNLYTANFTGHSTVFDHVAIYPVNNDNTVDTSLATEIIDSRNYLDTVVYADHNLQPVYVDRIAKSIYNKDMVLTGNVDLVNVDRINSDKDINININGVKKAQINETYGLVNQDGQPFSTGGFKNMLINGDFSVNQYLVAATSNFSSSRPFIDKWFVNNTSYVDVGQLIVPPPGFCNVLKMTKIVGADTQLVQRMEIKKDCAKKTFNGRKFTFSCYVYADSDNFIDQMYVLKNGISANSYEVRAAFRVNNTVANKWVRVWGTWEGSWTYDAGDYLELRIDPFDMAAGTMYVTGLQFEEGSVPTAFEFRPPALELALCQRYYETCSITYWGILSGTSNGNYRDWSGTFKATKRTTPTMTFTGSGFTPLGNGVTLDSWAANYLAGNVTTAYCLTGWSAYAEF